MMLQRLVARLIAQKVVERDRFATPNSLKSHGEGYSLSPVSNTLCQNAKVVHAFEASNPFEKLLRHSNHVPRLTLHSARRHRRCPTSRDSAPWRFSDAGRRSAWESIVMLASEDLHIAHST